MPNPIRVASIALFRNGKLLFGERKNTGRWCLPGGHLDDGEDPVKGAVRELLEETGLKPENVEYLGSAKIPSKNLIVYSFRGDAVGDAEADGGNDPDRECENFKWVDGDDLPRPLHNKEDVTLQFLGLQPRTLDLVHADEAEDLDKMALADVPHGKLLQASPTDKVWDYSHVLPSHHQGKYKIRLTTSVNRPEDKDASISVQAVDDSGQSVGSVSGGTDTFGNAKIDLAGVHPNHRQRGIGQALYEAFYAHALNHLGAGIAAGGYHSTSAGATQKKLATKHGLDYKQVQSPAFDGDEPGDFDDRYEPYRYTLKSETDLEKGLKQSLAGLGAAAAMSLTPAQVQQQPPESLFPGFSQAPQTQPSPTPSTSSWTPKGLHRELIPIAHLESGFGKQLEHAPHSRGSYHTAFGAVGLKAVTGHEEYKKNPQLQSLRPGLETPGDFEAAYKQDPHFYNAVASSHWQRLKSALGDAARAAYGWRWGMGAARKATSAQIQSSPYVQKYRAMEVQKSEELDKMAISDIPAGERVPSTEASATDYDYSHILSPEERDRGLRLMVRSLPAKSTWEGKIEPTLMSFIRDFKDPKTNLGRVQSRLMKKGKITQSQISEETPGLHIGYANLRSDYRGRGLGVKMYEALYSHAQKKHGVKVVEGDWHSTSAHRTHSALSRKHGLDYKPLAEDPHPIEEAPFDNRYKDYSYTIKSESDMEPLTKSALSRGWKPAFYNKATDHIVVTPGFHNANLLPDGEFTDDWIDGFVNAEGHFYNREETYQQVAIRDSMDLEGRQVPWQKSEEPMEKSQRSFRSRDGIRIPAHGTSERRVYDKQFLGALKEAFANPGQKELRPVQVPLESVMTTNQPVNKDRLDLYRRMVKKDKLPPVVVRKQGDIFTVVDGNHRLAAALEAGLSHIEGYEIVPVNARK